MVFLELRREPGVYTRVMVAMILQSSCLFRDVRTPVLLRGTPQETPRGFLAQYGCSKISGGIPRFPSSCHCDIGIPSNFQEEAGIVTF